MLETTHNIDFIDFVIDKPVTILSLIRYFTYCEATRQVLNPNKTKDPWATYLIIATVSSLTKYRYSILLRLI